jgi:hypothetical protein
MAAQFGLPAHLAALSLLEQFSEPDDECGRMPGRLPFTLNRGSVRPAIRIRSSSHD